MAQVIRLRRRVVNPYRPGFAVRRYFYNPASTLAETLGQPVSWTRRRVRTLLKKRRTRRASNARQARRKKNAGLLITLGTVNPGKQTRRRRNQVAMTRRKRNRRASRRLGQVTVVRLNPYRRARRRKNAVVRMRRRRGARVAARRRAAPVVVLANPSRRRRRARNPVRSRKVIRYYARRRNPQLFGRATGWGEAIGLVAASMAGMALTKFLPTVLPKGWVAGDIGRTLASGATAFLGYVVARDAVKLKGPLPDAVLLGGLVQTGSVALNAFLPQVAKPLGFSGMGAFANAQFPVPQNPILAGYQRPAIPAPAAAAAANSAVAQTAARMSSVSGLPRAFGSAF